MTKKKVNFGQSKSVWYHVFAVAALFALCGAGIAFVTPDTPADDPYKVLELTKSDLLSLPVQKRRSLLKSQYRQLTRKYHPDREGGSDEAFILLTRSYEKLESSLDSTYGYVPANDDEEEEDADEADLKKTLEEAKELMTSFLFKAKDSKLLRCVIGGGVLGLLVGTISKKKSGAG